MKIPFLQRLVPLKMNHKKRLKHYFYFLLDDGLEVLFAFFPMVPFLISFDDEKCEISLFFSFNPLSRLCVKYNAFLAQTIGTAVKFSFRITFSKIFSPSPLATLLLFVDLYYALFRRLSSTMFLFSFSTEVAFRFDRTEFFFRAQRNYTLVNCH